MNKLLSVLFVALFAAASVQAVAAEGQKVDKKETRIHKRARTHVKKAAHKRVAHKKLVRRKVAHAKVVHKNTEPRSQQK